MRRLDIYLIAGFVMMFAVAGSAYAKEKAPASAEAATGSGDVQHKVLSFNLEGLSDTGQKKWEVTGRSAEAVSENEVALDRIVAKAYGEEAEATITADQGVYNKAKNNVRLEKNVNATILATEKMGDEYFDFSAPAKDDQSKAPVTSAAGAKPEKKKTKTLITCDGEVTFDYERNIATFEKNVHVVSDETNINADKITVNLDPVSKKIYNIIADGNVRISRGENMTYSDKATYVEADKKIALTGNPKLVIYQDGGLSENILEKK